MQQFDALGHRDQHWYQHSEHPNAEWSSSVSIPTDFVPRATNPPVIWPYGVYGDTVLYYDGYGWLGVCELVSGLVLRAFAVNSRMYSSCAANSVIRSADDERQFSLSGA